MLYYKSIFENDSYYALNWTICVKCLNVKNYSKRTGYGKLNDLLKTMSGKCLEVQICQILYYLTANEKSMIEIIKSKET